MKILVIGPSWIGDMTISQSLYRTLKIKYPQAKIDVIAPEWSYPLLSFMPEVNEAITISLSHRMLAINARRALGYSLREKHYDHAFVLPNSFKSALVPFFANIPYRTGWLGEMRYGLLNDMRRLNKSAWPLMVERYVSLAYDKNIIRSAKDLPQPPPWPQFQTTHNLKSYLRHHFGISSERPVIGFCIGAEYGQAKRWPHYHFAELAKKLIDEKIYQIILFGSIKDREAGSKIFNMLNNKQKIWCNNLTGKTQLEQAVNLITICKAIITNDSGLMHVAAALLRPIVALYGPSSPEFTPPLSHRARVIRMITGYYKMSKNYIAAGSYHKSLVDIKPQYVLDELDRLISSGKNNRDASANH